MPEPIFITPSIDGVLDPEIRSLLSKVWRSVVEQFCESYPGIQPTMAEWDSIFYQSTLIKIHRVPATVPGTYEFKDESHYVMTMLRYS